MKEEIVSPNTRTPVSILQETLLKQHITPCFNTVFNGTGNEGTFFKIEVRAGDKTEFGVGRSKKEAKHNAAKNMLRIMSEEDSKIGKLISSEPVINLSSTDTISENSVGLLCNFCNKKQIAPPVITLEREEGPSHAKMFVMICKVLSFTSHGKSFKKKIAKQKAAQAMLAILNKNFGDDDTSEENQTNGEAKGKEDQDVDTSKGKCQEEETTCNKIPKLEGKEVDSLDTSKTPICEKRKFQEETTCIKKAKLYENVEDSLNTTKSQSLENGKLQEETICKKEKLDIPNDEMNEFLQYVENELKLLDSEEKRNMAKEMIKKIFNSLNEKENGDSSELTIEEKFAAVNKVVIKLLKEKNIELWKCRKAIVQVPIADHYKILCSEPFANKSQTLTSLKNRYKAEEIALLDNLQETFKTIMEDYCWTYSFKNLVPENDSSQQDDQKRVPPWSFVENGNTEDEVKKKLIATAMNFLYEMTSKNHGAIFQDL
ncbi:uncharacterized protein LOC106664224 isoform X2 [Cimex lectularius]|uniref:DRBM domain-containing protein n=1 Tax=Cimex lectularius TaxID=79782 RepID=A0A8I6RKT7_CIMLE|nr:uncharacterized protein LOC106664224 isoform X2 [Cimex lectularius]